MNNREALLGIFNSKYSRRTAGLEEDDLFANLDTEGDALTEVNGELDYLDEVETEEDVVTYEDETGLPDYDVDNDEENPDWNSLNDKDLEDSKRKPDDCVNIMELASQFTNKYRFTIKDIKSVSPTIIDISGDFDTHPLYNEFEEAFNYLDQLFTNEKCELLEELRGIRAILLNKRKAYTLKGDDKTPFVYEGLQLVYITGIHTLLLTVPYIIKLGERMDVVADRLDLKKHLEFISDIVVQINSMSDILGTSIKYIEPNVSEITGRSNELADTVYADSEIISQGIDMIEPEITYAGESIATFLELKENKALGHFNRLAWSLSLVATYAKALGADTTWKTIRDTVFGLIKNDDTSNIAEITQQACTTLDEILITYTQAYKEMEVSTSPEEEVVEE